MRLDPFFVGKEDVSSIAYPWFVGSNHKKIPILILKNESCVCVFAVQFLFALLFRSALCQHEDVQVMSVTVKGSNSLWSQHQVTAAGPKSEIEEVWMVFIYRVMANVLEVLVEMDSCSFLFSLFGFNGIVYRYQEVWLLWISYWNLA